MDHLANNDIDSRCKTQPPTGPGGLFTKDRFRIDLDDGTVTWPNAVTVTIRRGAGGDGTAVFGGACRDCPLRVRCTNTERGRTVRVGRYEQRLADARARAHDPDWSADYRATRPKVERKLGHMMRRRHGGRQARVRGKRKVDADFTSSPPPKTLHASPCSACASTPPPDGQRQVEGCAPETTGPTPKR